MPTYWLRDEYYQNLIILERLSDISKTKLLLSINAESRDIQQLFNDYVSYTVPWLEHEKKKQTDNMVEEFKKYLEEKKK